MASDQRTAGRRQIDGFSALRKNVTGDSSRSDARSALVDGCAAMKSGSGRSTAAGSGDGTGVWGSDSAAWSRKTVSGSLAGESVKLLSLSAGAGKGPGVAGVGAGAGAGAGVRGEAGRDADGGVGAAGSAGRTKNACFDAVAGPGPGGGAGACAGGGVAAGVATASEPAAGTMFCVASKTAAH